MYRIRPPAAVVLSLSACDTALHLISDGSIIRAPSGIEGTASWDPLTKTIVVGPGVVYGIGPCSGPSGEFGGVLGRPLELQSARLLKAPAPVDPCRGSGWRSRTMRSDRLSTPLWIFDPATGLAYTAGNRAYADRGGRLIDFNRTPPEDVLVNTAWPYGNMIGAVAVDTTNHWAMLLGTGSGGGQGTIEMWNLNGLSMTKYSAKSPFAPDTGWTVTGDTDLLSNTSVAGLTYNPNLGAFVAWTGGSTVYFLYPNYQSKVINILGKIDIPGGPPATTDNLYGGFTYIPDKNVYLAFSNVRNDFYLLVPPGGLSHPRVR